MPIEQIGHGSNDQSFTKDADGNVDEIGPAGCGHNQISRQAEETGNVLCRLLQQASRCCRKALMAIDQLVQQLLAIAGGLKARLVVGERVPSCFDGRCCRLLFGLEPPLSVDQFGSPMFECCQCAVGRGNQFLQLFDPRPAGSEVTAAPDTSN